MNLIRSNQHGGYLKFAFLLVVGVTLVAAAPALAQSDTYGYLGATWPPVTTYVTLSNDGWAWAVGRLEGTYGRVVWQRRLAPADGGIVIRRGWETTYVEVGPRRFVLENSTGKAMGMGPGTYWVRTPPGYPRRAYPPTPPPTPTPPATTTEVVPPTGSPPLPTVTSPAIRAVESYGQTLKVVQDISQRLVLALATAEKLRDVATAAQMSAAEQNVARTRQELRNAQSRVRSFEQRLETSGITLYVDPGRDLAPITPSLRPAEKAERDLIHADVLVSTMAYNKLAEQLEGLRRAAASPERISEVRDRLTTLETQLAADQMRLEELKMIEALRPQEFPNARLEAKFDALKTRIRDLSERLWIAQGNLREASRGEVEGRSAQLQHATDTVLDLSKQRTDAYRDLQSIAEQSGVQVRPTPAPAAR